MLKILQDIWKGNPTPEIALAITKAQTAALFFDYRVRDIDPATASDDELEAAISECRVYWAVAYPENDNERVEAIESSCKSEIGKRLDKRLRQWL